MIERMNERRIGALASAVEQQNLCHTKWQRRATHLRVVVQLQVGRVIKGGGEHIKVVPGGIFPL